MSRFQHIKTLLQGSSATSSHWTARELLKNLLAMAWFVGKLPVTTTLAGMLVI